ncbi:secondary metabolism biosynthetic enzyme [Penicillium argentinense]|uniref:Aromatic prenyltransferase n=1 Tax=Penicillium argentinense TaxID=1131581 RepID=A0A9W9FCZ9_9EURO|nr:secondary metabolism biosynthetic enzyme [Penicillium argentinense]KAJ5097825.1 secondary metabolism biosynthetic enzyme [Penicillium argentinense]
MPVKQPPRPSFSEERFLNDISNASTALGVPYSENTTRRILSVFRKSFHQGCVLWRTTDQPNGELNYRVYERQSIDMVALAMDAGLISKNDVLVSLVQSWSSLYGEESHQLADFDAARGLVKFWVYLGSMRPLVEVFGVPELPACIKRHQDLFVALNLTHVRHTAVDLEKKSINLYFRTTRGFAREVVDEYISIAGADPISDTLFEEIRQQFPKSGGTFAVTMDFATGKISRVAFYALRLSPEDMPSFNERIWTFFQVCLSYDEEEMMALAWSFGKGRRSYIKAEHSHSGALVELLRQWNTPMTDGR